MGKWTIDLSKYAELQKKKIKDIRKSFVFQLYSSIVQKTPVDTGRARANWDVTIKTPSTSQTKSTKVKFANKHQLPKADNDESFFIANNLPYIETLEYGLYPDPVKRGSWDKNKKMYVKKSQGGFSKQAPNGMVGVTVASADDYMDIAIRENK